MPALPGALPLEAASVAELSCERWNPEENEQANTYEIFRYVADQQSLNKWRSYLEGV